MDMTDLIKALIGGGGGPVGTAQEPWNPAAKINAGLGGMPQMPMGGQPNMPPPQTSIGGKIGNAVIPQTMAAKGGASGG